MRAQPIQSRPASTGAALQHPLQRLLAMASTLAFQVPCPVLPARPLARARHHIAHHAGAPTWRPKRARTSLWRMCDASSTSPEEPQDEPDALETIRDRDWREFRAALVAGSTQALEEKKQTAYRKGHWAHPVRLMHVKLALIRCDLRVRSFLTICVAMSVSFILARSSRSSQRLRQVAF